MIKVIKKINSIPLKLKELMIAVKEAGGDLDQQMNAQKIFKNYLEKKIYKSKRNTRKRKSNRIVYG